MLSIYLLAWIEALDGSKGESPLANSSEFTNSLQSSISGRREYEAVVFPAPLQPDIIYKRGIIQIYKFHDNCVAPQFLFMGDTVAEKGEIPFARVFRPYFPECIRDFTGGNDVLLSASGQSQRCGLVIYVNIQWENQFLFI